MQQQQYKAWYISMQSKYTRLVQEGFLFPLKQKPANQALPIKTMQILDREMFWSKLDPNIIHPWSSMNLAQYSFLPQGNRKLSY